MGCGSGDGVPCEGGESRRLVSSSPSLSSSTSQRRFLVHLAGGETGGDDGGGDVDVTGGGDVDAAWTQAEVVGAITGGGQAVMVAEGHRWRRRHRLRVLTAVACVVKRQKRVTS
jgi:hypothetical protein